MKKIRKGFKIKAKRRSNPLGYGQVLLLTIGQKYADIHVYSNYIEAFQMKKRLENEGHEAIILMDPVNHIERLKKQFIEL